MYVGEMNFWGKEQNGVIADRPFNNTMVNYTLMYKINNYDLLQFPSSSVLLHCDKV